MSKLLTLVHSEMSWSSYANLSASIGKKCEIFFRERINLPFLMRFQNHLQQQFQNYVKSSKSKYLVGY